MKFIAYKQAACSSPFLLKSVQFLVSSSAIANHDVIIQGSRRDEKRLSLIFSSRGYALVSRGKRLRRSRGQALRVVTLQRKIRDCSQSMRIAVANTLPVIGSNCRSVWVFSFCIQKIQISNVRFNVRTVCLKRIIVPFIPIFPVRNKTSSIQLACSRLVWFLMCLVFRFLDACKEAF